MPYGKMRVKPISKFGEWLNMQLMTHDMSADELGCGKLHCSHGVVYQHRSGKYRPTFTDVVAYCWAFDCLNTVEEVWALVDIPVDD